jgi:hypothetical protein
MSASHCPECNQPRFAFVFLPDGVCRCTDCHRSRLAVTIVEQHTVRTVVANKWIFIESRLR